MRKVIRAPWFPLFVTVILGSIAYGSLKGQFFTQFNVFVILSEAAILFVIGAAQLVVLSVGEFNLAVGGIGALSGITLGYLAQDGRYPLVLGVAATLAVGALCGLLNGLVVALSKVNSFIVTLATGGLFSGIALGATSAAAYTQFPGALVRFGQGHWGFVPVLILGAAVTAIYLSVLYRWRPLGRAFLAVGGSRETAELSGLSSRRAVVWAHALSGLLAAVAAAMSVANIQSASPSAGSTWLIESFVIAIIGGTSLVGGVVSVTGALVAALLLAVIQDALIVSNVNPYWVTAINGLVVFVAVLFGRQIWRRRKRPRSGRLLPWRGGARPELAAGTADGGTATQPPAVGRVEASDRSRR